MIDSAIEINPKLAILYNNRGNLYRDLQMYDKAEDDYNKAIFLNKKYFEAYNGLGFVYGNKREFQKSAGNVFEISRY